MKMRGQSSAEEHSSLIPDPSSCLARRGFLGRAAAWAVGGAAAAVPFVTGIVAFLNPLGQKSRSGQFLPLASLDMVPEDGTPKKFPVIRDHTDAWTHFPPEPIGAVFLRRVGGLAAAGTAAPGLAAAGTAPRRSWRFRWFARMPAARSISSHRRAAAVSSAPATRPVSTSLASAPRPSRLARATWTRWQSKSATRARSGSGSRPSPSARRGRQPPARS